jgi:primosomal replication protein N''
MTSLVRICPQCGTERPSHEAFCEGAFGDSICNWPLTAEPVRAAGQVVNPEVMPQPAALHCPNGHTVAPGDQICLECGSLISETLHPTDEASADAALPSEIGGWKVIEGRESVTGVWDRFVVEQDGRRALLTLYAANAEPDPAVQAVLQRMDRDHVPEFYEIGRWDSRAFEVTEIITGQSLVEANLDLADTIVLRRVIDEIGRALNGFATVGLRHRGLTSRTVLLRSIEPLDLVITDFGSARLSDFDLESVAALQVSRYSSPETIVGGVAAASDWWSFGILLLECLTHGKCFEDVNDQAWHIHVVTRGVGIPEILPPEVSLLLRGLLARDPLRRWQWAEVQSWLEGRPVGAPVVEPQTGDAATGRSLPLGGREYRRAENYALAAAEAGNWTEAQDAFRRGSLATWLDEIGENPSVVSTIRKLEADEELSDDLRFSLVLMALNEHLPLTLRGEIITPAWLLRNVDEGFALVTSKVISHLTHAKRELWLVNLAARVTRIRERAAALEISLDDNRFKTAALATSRTNLESERTALRKVYPDSEHSGLASLLEHDNLPDEELILLVCANTSQFTPLETLLDAAENLARECEISAFQRAGTAALLTRPRREIYSYLDARTAEFAQCGLGRLDEWTDSFRVERRISLPRAAVLLSLPPEIWRQPPKQNYVSALIEHFQKRITSSVQRGPLVRFTIGKTTARVDLYELGTALTPAQAMLDQFVRRTGAPVHLDPAAFERNDQALVRIRRLVNHALTFKRDTGIDGRYLGFPFLMVTDRRHTTTHTKPRIMPVLLWPANLEFAPGALNGTLSFDTEREEVRLNPALEAVVGSDAIMSWRNAREELLRRSTIRSEDIIDIFGQIAPPSERVLRTVPSKDAQLANTGATVVCAAAVFNAEFSGQAIGEDLRNLARRTPADTSLEAAFRLVPRPADPVEASLGPSEHFLTIESDPSQEAAVATARHSPGLILEGPPGTGKSQTIVNIVSDSIGRGETILIVCQKQAALRVVEKRLQAEGLGDRIVSIVDSARDRKPILNSVREQLSGLANSTDRTHALRRRRELAGARVAALESELDRHYEALHTPDPLIDMTYREILGELISVEGEGTWISVAELRKLFEPLTRAAVTTIGESCAPLARLWLDSKFEESALHVLKRFSADAAIAELMRDALTSYVDAELARAGVLGSHPAGFEISDPAPYNAWFSMYGQRFATMDQVDRISLAKWLELFSPDGAGKSVGDQVVAELESLLKILETMKTPRADFPLLERVSKLSDTAALTLGLNADRATQPAPFPRNLSLARFLNRKRCKEFLRSINVDPSESALVNLRDTLSLELKMRPLRSRLRAALERINENPKVPLEPSLVEGQIIGMLSALREVHISAGAVRGFAAPALSVAMAKSGSAVGYIHLCQIIDGAIKRHDARVRSLALLDVLYHWFEETWLIRHRNAITGNSQPLDGVSEILEAIRTLSAFQQFRSRALELDKNVLATFKAIRPMERTMIELPPDRLVATIRDTIRREALLAWKGRSETAHPVLQLQIAEIETRIANLKAADAEFRSANREYLASFFDRQTIASRSAFDAVTRLTGPRALKLREFIDQAIPLGLAKLRPVWLMNPDTASRVLPLRAGMFDVVIFDEASQLLVEHSVAPLYRAKRAVVCGDEKQMPPTSFFSARWGSDEDDDFAGDDPEDFATDRERELHEETWNRREIKDCPDLLALARETLFPRMLEIHYRSKYRELIAYSNSAFYGNRLSVPIRHPDAEIRRVKPIEVIRVDSVYESQTNPEEARVVVDRIASIWKNVENNPPSIGVVTFNLKQTDLINQLMDERAATDQPFKQSLVRERERVQDAEDMGFFVKNVENVQGDERDMIIFSTTFGRDKKGSFKRLFGALGQLGGERRLNVAVTRAREKVILVTSMPIGDISDMLASGRPPNKPRDYLQGYLDYATKINDGDIALAHATASRFSGTGKRTNVVSEVDGFVTSVAAYITELGHKPVQCSDGDTFGVDLAIEDARTGLFGLAIECDSPRDNSGHLKTARARELWRPAMLRRAIPFVHRVSSFEWYHSSDAEKTKLRVAVEQALH